ncbi:hypothetical protein U1Q18_001443, partial [Sarracenia purpurea var. burkii]
NQPWESSSTNIGAFNGTDNRSEKPERHRATQIELEKSYRYVKRILPDESCRKQLQNFNARKANPN